MSSRLAEQFEYTDYWNLIAKRADIFQRPGWPGWYHAYGHVNTFSGAGAAYLAKGDAHYLEVLKAGYDFIQQRTFATGGYGPNEVLTPPDQLSSLLRTTTRSFETQCGSWAAFKLAKYLILFTGDAKYGDWIERLVINATGASIPMEADGRVFYYSDYNLGGGVKRNTETGWPCCSGRIDGVVAGVIDQYRPVRGEKTHWDFLGLRAGRHEVKLTVLAKPNPKSKQNHVNLAGFTPLGTGGP